jgi:NADPH2:quinone reductase
MRAIRVHAFNEAPRLEDLPEPQAADGFSIVQMHAATVSHLDRTVWGGKFLRHPPLPYVPGVEAAGTVVQSARFARGTRVWLRGAGLGVARDGTWRERIVVPDAALGALPDRVPLALGSAFFSPCTAAWVALHEVGRVKAGERVLITGVTGAAGSIAAQLGCEAGVVVLAGITDDSQLARLPQGIDAVRIGEATACADVLIDTIGGAGLPAALRAVVPGGRAVLVGYTAGTSVALDLPELMQRDVSLLPLNMLRREVAGREAVDGLLERLADGRLTLQVTTFPMADAARALTWITERGHAGRAILVP